VTEITNTAFYQTKKSSSGVQDTPMTLKDRMESLFFDLVGKVIPAETKEARHEALENAFNRHTEYLKPASLRVNRLRKDFEEKIIKVDQLEQRADVAKGIFKEDEELEARIEFNKIFFRSITNKQNIPIKTPSFEGDNCSILDDEERW